MYDDGLKLYHHSIQVVSLARLSHATSSEQVQHGDEIEKAKEMRLELGLPVAAVSTFLAVPRSERSSAGLREGKSARVERL